MPKNSKYTIKYKSKYLDEYSFITCFNKQDALQKFNDKASAKNIEEAYLIEGDIILYSKLS